MSQCLTARSIDHVVLERGEGIYDKMNGIGAHEVINPESIIGQRVAMRLAHEGIRDELTLGPDLAVTEIVAPIATVGHGLAGLPLLAPGSVVTLPCSRPASSGPETIT